MTSKEAREAVAAGQMASAEAVDELIAAGDHRDRKDCVVYCPECGSAFWRSHFTRWNTCSDECQRQWNCAIFDLDGGATILKAEEITSGQLSELLVESGMSIGGGGKRRVPS